MQTWKKRFITLWIGQAISILTSSIMQMCIIWYLSEKTGSAAVLSMATLIGFLPQAILGTFIGVYIDRYNRKTIMIISDLFIAAVGIALVIITAGGDIPIGYVYFALFARSVGAAFHAPSLQALTPLIVPEDKITQCVGFSQSFQSISMVASPAIAGALFGFFDLNFMFLLDGAGALLAVIILFFLKVPKSCKPIVAKHPPFWSDFMAGLRVLKSRRGLTSLLLVSTVYAVIYGPIGSLYPLITMTYFGGTIRQSSVVEVIFSVGMLLGSLCLGIWGGKIKKSRAMFFSMFSYGILLCIEGSLSPGSLYAFAGVTAILGINIPFFTGIKTAVLQSKIQDEYRGRVLSLSSSITMFAMPLGLILSGAFAGTIGINRWFFFSGCASILLSLVLVSLPSIKHCCDEK